MKKCSHCGRVYSDFVTACSYCGASLAGGGTSQQPQQPAYQQPRQPVYQQPRQPAYQQPQQPAYQQPRQPAYQQAQQATYQQPQQPVNQQPTAGNAVTGLLGAALLALGGGVVQVLLTYTGFAGSYGGIVAYVLAIGGYEYFAHKNSTVLIKILCALLAGFMVVLGVVAGCGFLVAKANEVPLSEAMRIIRSTPRIFDAMTEDIGANLAFCGAAVVISFFLKRKKK